MLVPERKLKGPNEQPVTMKVSVPLLRRLDEIAEATERTRSSVARMLIQRGLRLYEVDGELIDNPLDPNMLLAEVAHFGTAGKKKK